MKRILVFSLALLQLLFPSLSEAHRWGVAGNERINWEKRSERAQRWFLQDLPRHVGNDFKETFWNPGHHLLMTIGLFSTLVMHEKDDEIQEAFHPEEVLGKAGDVFNIMGNNLVLGGATLLALGLADLYDAPKATLTAGTMLEAFAITQALTYALKFSTGRTRPDGSNDRSFPSGHASGAFALATVAEVFYGPLIGIPAYSLASLIAVSRLDANKHFASDTLAGALIGTLIGLGTAKFHKKEYQNLFLVPAAGKSPVGISIVRRF